MADLRAFVAGWMDAFNRRDWAAYAACFTEDVSYLTPGRNEPLVGRQAHVAQDQRNAGTARLEPGLVVIADDGSHVVVEGVFQSEERRSKWVTILEIQGGLIAAERLYFDRSRG
ncbi:MAG: nuclear transport factor 2 family protein [Dehalococcoidia bacterium]